MSLVEKYHLSNQQHKGLIFIYDRYLVALLLFPWVSLSNFEINIIMNTIGDLVSKETVCCVGGKVKH